MVESRVPDPGRPGAPRGAGSQAELFARLFGTTQVAAAPLLKESEGTGVPSLPPALRSRQAGGAGAMPAAPLAPTGLADCGLSLLQVSDLMLKQLYLGGNLLGVEMARQARLPFNVVDESLQFLKDEKCVEVTAGEIIGRISYRFALTDLGRIRARECFEQCRYVGPAPVPLETYVKQCLKQTVTGTVCSMAA